MLKHSRRHRRLARMRDYQFCKLFLTILQFGDITSFQIFQIIFISEFAAISITEVYNYMLLACLSSFPLPIEMVFIIPPIPSS
jgi:hypothetical protein